MVPSGPPNWLFGGSSNASDRKPSKPKAGEGARKTQKGKEIKKGKELKTAEKNGKASPVTNQKAPFTQSPLPPPAHLLEMVDRFLAENVFDKAHRAFNKQRQQSEAGANTKTNTEISGDRSETLVDLYRFWEAAQTNNGSKSKVTPKAGEMNTSSDEDSSGSSSSSSSSTHSSSSSENTSGDSESCGHGLRRSKAKGQKLKVFSSNLKKRKVPSSSSSSTSSSDSNPSSGVSSDSEQEPQPKKQKTAACQATPNPVFATKMDVDDSSASDSDSSSHSEPGAPSSKPGPRTECGSSSDPDSSSSSESDSSSSSESESSSDPDSEGSSDSDLESSSNSDAESLAEVQEAVRVPLPGSDSSSTSSDSESVEGRARATSTHKIKPAQTVNFEPACDSSVTLGSKSPERKAGSATNPPLPPYPVKAGPTPYSKGRSKQPTKERFSRIPKDIQVVERFASNDYVAMDYSRRAWEDLVVTKGKGFTKGKNKMKKGGFRGGAIDINQKGGVVYFDE